MNSIVINELLLQISHNVVLIYDTFTQLYCSLSLLTSIVEKVEFLIKSPCGAGKDDHNYSATYMS